MKLKGKKLTSALVLLSFIGYMPLSTSMAMANVDANAMFKTEYSINGSTSIVDITSPITNQAGKEMQAINQAGNSGVAIFGLSGDLGANNGLNSVKTAGSQTSVFNFIGDGPTHINGYIKDSCVGDCVGNAATGRDVFINAAGIMFGEGSRVNLNSATFSTSGINGLSNEQIEALKGMSASERAAYLKPFATNMTFIGNPTGTASITGTSTDIYADKSLAFVSNNVNFKDSLLRTNLAFNYGGGNDGVHNQSFSNLKIVTADGVNFQYLTTVQLKQLQLQNQMLQKILLKTSLLITQRLNQAVFMFKTQTQMQILKLMLKIQSSEALNL